MATAIFPSERVIFPWKAPLLLFLGVFALAGCTDLLSMYGLTEKPVVSRLEASLVRGRDRFAAGHYGLAVEAFRDAIKADPNSVEALNGLAAAYDQIGRYDLAIYHYE
ncbi:MAG: tetratricopeptide repeat protein, partial [Alphaproteobacteria bacterium]